MRSPASSTARHSEGAQPIAAGWLSVLPFRGMRLVSPRGSRSSQDGLGWRALPRAAQVYVAAVIALGTIGLAASFPRAYPLPLLFAFLLAAGCLTSLWKVSLPIPLSSGSTLSVSYAADLTTLLLLGPGPAVIVSVAGVWTQCTFKVRKPYPPYRTAFSMAAEAATMVATGLVYVALGAPSGPLDLSGLAKPLVGAIATYFIVNTGLVAGAIALSTRRSFWRVWRRDFLWSGASYMVAGTAGALAAFVVQRGEHWKAVLLLAPVYLTYRTYRIFVGRLEDHERHAVETQRLHEETLEALAQARRAESALAQEKERLARTLTEMTHLQALRDQLLEREQAARAGAEEANRLKDQFLAVVSHELRTPLNAILGWADMLRSGRLDESRRERAHHAVFDSARRQAQLIDDLLDVARIMSGKLLLERAPVDLAEIVRGAVEVVQPAADAKGVRIAVHADRSIAPVLGDAARLQQIAWNLLSNAVKFSPEGSTVRVRLSANCGIAEMVVDDSGEGIPSDFLPSVFEPFRQADGSTTRLHGGLGLGLAIVKHLVEAHGGTIGAESGGEGRGARFTVRLPIAPAAADPHTAAEHASAQAANPANAPASLEGLSVLVVDDDDGCRDVVAAHLESRHAVVLTAASAAQALDLLRRVRVDVLLADVAMPGEDGYSLIRKLRALDAANASIPAAALTAFAREEDRRQALRAGFQLHLAKPIDAESLVAAVATLCRLSPT
jgi:signal transduction histidine kinase/ActR/RegA family two-component response regulator